MIEFTVQEINDLNDKLYQISEWAELTVKSGNRSDHYNMIEVGYNLGQIGSLSESVKEFFDAKLRSHKLTQSEFDSQYIHKQNGSP